MRFGQKRSEAPAQVDGGNYLRNFRKGETKVRFIENPSEWIEYREHYTADNKMFPCSRKTLGWCPGCESESEKLSRSSRKYATSLYLVEAKKVVPFKIPVGLANALERRQERSEDNTITDRDYVVVRSGEGLDTTYDVDPDDRYSMDINALLKEKADIEAIFLEKFTEAWPDVSLTGGKPEPLSEKATERILKKVEEQDDRPNSDASSDDEIELDEADVRRMTLPELAELAEKAGVDISDANDKAGVVRILLNKLSA